MNRHLATLPRIAGAALAIAAAATFSIAGAAAAQAGEQHSALGSSPQFQTAQLRTAQLQTAGYGIGGLAVSVQTDIQKPGH